MHLSVPDGAGITYPVSVVEEACLDLGERIQKYGGVLGECSIPPGVIWDGDPTERYTAIDLSRASHIVRHVWIENKQLHCKVQLLSKYAEISEFLNVDFLGIPRSTGVIDDASKTCTTYTLITVDLALPELT